MQIDDDVIEPNPYALPVAIVLLLLVLLLFLRTTREK
jgi:hypothetical protein